MLMQFLFYEHLDITQHKWWWWWTYWKQIINKYWNECKKQGHWKFLTTAGLYTILLPAIRSFSDIGLLWNNKIRQTNKLGTANDVMQFSTCLFYHQAKAVLPWKLMGQVPHILEIFVNFKNKFCNNKLLCVQPLENLYIHYSPKLNRSRISIDEHLLGHHMYADDTQMMAHLTINDIPSVATRLQNCIKAIQVWCNSRRLQLNPTKTELIWFGSRTNLKKIADLDLNLYRPDIIKPVNVVRDLCFYLDSELSMEHHISTIVRACIYYLCHLESIHRILSPDVTSGLVLAFVTTRTDYWNSSVVNRSTATGPECSRQTHHLHRNTRTHHSCASESALAPC